MKTEIEIYNPCNEALEFRKQFATFKEAWEVCPRGDWMLWIAKKLDVDLRVLTKAKVECAKTVIHLMRDQRSINALDVATKFANGEATREDLNTAYADAYAAYAAAAYADAAYAAAYAADAYADAAYADAAYADAAAREANRKKTADLCREILTEIVFQKLGI